MYTVITIQSRLVGDSPIIELECYGPFNSKAEANKQAKAIKRRCLKLVEYMWGNITEGKSS